MFTGLIESIGIIKSVKKSSGSVRLTILADKMASEVKVGESISVNGVCLTAAAVNPPHIEFDVVQETIDKSSLNHLSISDRVNLERAMKLGDRLDGHMVQGHIDGVGVIRSIRSVGDDYRITIYAEPEIMRYVAQKGSIAVDGISLTIAEVNENSFTVAIIPQTLSSTTINEKKAGSTVNLETDIIGRYVYKYISKIAESDDKSLMTKLEVGGFLE